MIKVAASLAALVAVSSVFGQGVFNFHEVVSDKQFDWRSVNSNGDAVAAVYTNTGNIGSTSIAVYNSALGFQNTVLTDLDQIIGKYSTGGYLYSTDNSTYPMTAIYRTKVGGAKSAIDFTNGGQLQIGPTIERAYSFENDKIIFSDTSHTYLWSEAQGTRVLGNQNLSTQGFTNDGSVVINSGPGIFKLAADGTQTPIFIPAEAYALGTPTSYSETPSGTKRYSGFKMNNIQGGFSTLIYDYIVPSGASSPFVVVGQSLNVNGQTTYLGQYTLGMNDNGLAVTKDWATGLLDNQTGFDIVDRNGVLRSGYQIYGYDASSNYIVGSVGNSNLGAFTQVIGTYSGTPTTVPEPANLAVLGLGAIALLRRRRHAKRPA
jgi:PEP-CTERM motif